jgi:hypothetical protein
MQPEPGGQEAVKKCKIAISAKSALRNFSFRRPVGDDWDIRRHFGSPEKSGRSISSQLPDGTFPEIPT